MTSFIVSTLVTTIKAIVSVLVVYFVGYLLVYLKIVGKESTATISKLSNYVFIPALTFTSLGYGLDLEVLKHSYHLVLSSLVLSAYYAIFARYCLVFLAKPTKRFERMFVFGQFAVSFVAIPLALNSSFCSLIEFEKPVFFQTEEELKSNATFFFTKEECISTGELYLFMYSSFTGFFFFTFGWNYIAALKAPPPKTENEKSLEEGIAKPEKKQSTTTSVEPLKLKEKLKSFSQRFLEVVIYRPVNSSKIVAIFLALIPPFKKTFFEEDGFLEPISAGIRILSTGTSPMLNLLIAITLGIKITSLESWKAVLGNEEKLGVSKRTILLAAISRMIIVPGVSFAWFYFVVEAVYPEDKLMKLIAFVELFVPSANVGIMIAQIEGQPDNAETYSVIVLLQFLIGSISMTGYSFLAIYLLDIKV
eukprot:maker-scaffold_31-snap-gene-1.2-mRNA-1 protein AED:0.30 eAED:0.30 QI:140/1/1/1/1/1/2/17/419